MASSEIGVPDLAYMFLNSSMVMEPDLSLSTALNWFLRSEWLYLAKGAPQLELQETTLEVT